MLAREVLVRNLRDRRAVARYAGLTGAPDESGAKRREKGLAKAGNARVRRSLIQLAWQVLVFQKDSALARWYVGRTSGPNGARRTTMIVALARKLLIALGGSQPPMLCPRVSCSGRQLNPRSVSYPDELRHLLAICGKVPMPIRGGGARVSAWSACRTENGSAVSELRC